jgi:hypothetical protein
MTDFLRTLVAELGPVGLTVGIVAVVIAVVALWRRRSS